MSFVVLSHITNLLESPQKYSRMNLRFSTRKIEEQKVDDELQEDSDDD